MEPSAYGIFEIKKEKSTGNAVDDMQHAKFRHWHFLELEKFEEPYVVKAGYLGITVELDEHNLLPFHTGKEFVKFVKIRIKDHPEDITVKYF